MRDDVACQCQWAVSASVKRTPRHRPIHTGGRFRPDSLMAKITLRLLLWLLLPFGNGSAGAGMQYLLIVDMAGNAMNIMVSQSCKACSGL